ncbi:MAG: FecR domain-containing protein [Alphaproteobacteria bacterium]|nr:FecR domain-containing protein [Alphaproteobacteria bacterium]
MNRIATTLMTALAATTLWTAPSLAQDATQAGVSAAVRGEVALARANAVGRQVVSAEPIFLRDQITSGADSGMQILLLDETVFTIGPESEMTIDEFVYDPATRQGSLAASMGKGVMRFVTGNISAGTPENMTIKLPVGTIGIRGTIGVVSVLSPDQAQQQFPQQTSTLNPAPGQPVVFAALAGPGPLTQTNANTGSFNFSSPNGSVDLNRPGGAVLASPGQPPVFFIAPPGAIQQVSAPLRGRGQQQQSGSDQQQQQAGGAQSEQMGNANENSGASSDPILQALNDPGETQAPLPVPESPAGDSTTFNDLAGIFGSTGSATASVPLSGMASAPNASASVSISFSARHMSLSGSNMPGGTFNTISGMEAQLNDSSTGASFSDSQLNCSNCSGTVKFTGGTGLNVTVTEGGETGSGSGNLH